MPSRALAIASGIRVARRTPFLQVVKTSVAVALAWLAAGVVMHVELPIFGAIAALLVVQPSVNQSLGRAIERSLGVVVGVLLAVVATAVLGQHGWLVLVAVAVVLLLAWALRIGASSANQAAISALLVLSIGVTTPQYGINRVLETLIGAAVGVLVNAVIAPPVLLRPAHLAVGRFGRDIATALDALAAALATATDDAARDALLARARLLRTASSQAKAALDQGDESLLLNPRRSRNRDLLEADRALWRRIDPVATQVVGMTRSVRDGWQDAMLQDPVVARIGDECRRAATDLRSLMAERDAATAVRGRCRIRPSRRRSPCCARTRSTGSSSARCWRTSAGSARRSSSRSPDQPRSVADASPPPPAPRPGSVARTCSSPRSRS